MISTATTIADVRARIAAARPGTVALVPTMGALHDGHLALVSRARASADLVVVSIFVNPLQFAPTEDLDRYPRTLEADTALLEAAGVDLLFAPAVTEMYPSPSPATRVVAGPVAARFEGASRPGHFDGVLTVVAKLLNIVAPDRVLFGRKDAQQVFLVRQMVRDLDLPVVVDVVDTVREADGLARSSRNRYLDEAARRAARTLHAALLAAESTADAGPEGALAAARRVISGEPAVALDYFALVDPGTFDEVADDYRGAALAIVAARVGGTRLIDNIVVHLA